MTSFPYQGFQGFGAGGDISLQDILSQLAQTKGQPLFRRVVGTGRLPGKHPGFGGFRPEAEMKQVGTRGGFFEQLSASMFGDIQRQQQAADRQHQRLGEQTAGFEEFIQGRAGDFEQLAGEQAGVLGSEAERLRAMGEGQLSALEEDRAKFEEFKTDTLGNLEERLGRSEKTFGDAIRRFEKEQTQALPAAIAAGIRADAQAQMKEIQSGLRPDGSMMTEAERQDAMMQVQTRTARQVQQAVVPVQERAQENLAQLRVGFSQLQQGNAALEAQIRTEFGRQDISFQQQKTQLQGVQAQLGSMAANLVSLGEQLRSAAQLNAVNFEMQGRLSVSELIRQNPESVVGVFAGLAALLQAATIPGAGGIPPVQLP